MVRSGKVDAPLPGKIFVPFLNASDPRMYGRNGELIKPYGIVEFEYKRTELCPNLNHDRAFYREVSRREFDPTGCVPITYFSIEKIADDLTEAQELVEKSIPDNCSAQSVA